MINKYKKQVILALFCLSVGIFSNNAIAMDKWWRKELDVAEKKIDSLLEEVNQLENNLKNKEIRNKIDDGEKLYKQQKEQESMEERRNDCNDQVDELLEYTNNIDKKLNNLYIEQSAEWDY